VLGRAYDAPKPAEFGTKGKYWENRGWRVDKAFTPLTAPIRPKAEIDSLRPLLPEKYSPLTRDGNGLQQVYLAEVPNSMADELRRLLNVAGNVIGQFKAPTDDRREEVLSEIADGIENNGAVPEGGTEALQFGKSRRGQGRFRKNVLSVEPRCRLTGVGDPELLVASHVKPWIDCSDEERIDGANGLMLTPTVDRLFDRGLISFSDEGELLVSARVSSTVLLQLGLPGAGASTGLLAERLRAYMAYHRDNVFLG
jgi:putative restriction endonuclease